jgi:hypothetical protein
MTLIGKVLVDDSYRDALTSISQSPDHLSTTKLEEELKIGAMDNIMGAYSKYVEKKDLPSVLAESPALQESQNAYLDRVKQKIEQEKQRLTMKYKWDRFIEHLRENILHYYQAIWSQQDSQQQLLKLKKSGPDKLGIKIPAKWKFIGQFGNTDYEGHKYVNTIYDLLNEVIDYQLRPPEINEEDFKDQIQNALEELEKDIEAEIPDVIDFEKNAIREEYNRQIQNMTTDYKDECRVKIIEEKTRIVTDLSMRYDTRIKLLEDKAESAINNAYSLLRTADIYYNSKIPSRFDKYKIKSTLEDKNKEAIKQHITYCQKINRDFMNYLSKNKKERDYFRKFIPISNDYNSKLGRGRGYVGDYERTNNTIKIEIARKDDEISREQSNAEWRITRDYDTRITKKTAELTTKRDADLITKEQRILKSFSEEKPKRLEWLRKKLLRDLKEEVAFQGRFEKFEKNEFIKGELEDMGIDPDNYNVDITEIINPAGIPPDLSHIMVITLFTT